jgi:hypothetical protein
MTTIRGTKKGVHKKRWHTLLTRVAWTQKKVRMIINNYCMNIRKGNNHDQDGKGNDHDQKHKRK